MVLDLIMNDFPQIKIIHVSDIHFGKNHICNPQDPSGSGRGYLSLAKLIVNDASHPDWTQVTWASKSDKYPDPPLLLAITGDITQRAEPDEFDQAYEFITSLLDKELFGCKTSLNETFVVPGNHDVVFNKKESEHRFGEYCNFYNKLYEKIQPSERKFARPVNANELNTVHVFPENRFLIAEVNSCLYVEKETEDESRGQVDQEAIRSLRSQLEDIKTESRDWIKVALMHHHPVLFPTLVEPGRGYDSIVNANSLLRLLREHGFHLILHGHKHFPQLFTYDPEAAWAIPQVSIPQLIVAGGSCGSKGLPEGLHQCNTYNLITMKWNPSALQGRVEVITRGLVRTGNDCALDPDQWSWKTIRRFDKILSPYTHIPRPGPARREAFPDKRDTAEDGRNKEYSRLRFNMPVVEVMPSVLPGMGYEARVWLVKHRYHQESPIRVTWSAGDKFERKVCKLDAAPEFCVSFHYWGPMVIQAVLEFADNTIEYSYMYARLPETANLDSND